MEHRHEFDLSAKEWAFLTQLSSQDASVADLVGPRIAVSERAKFIHLSCSEAEDLRELLTIKLAELGFDEDYSPNEEGDMLERLIEKFFMPQ